MSERTMGRFRLAATSAAIGFLLGAIAMAAFGWQMRHALLSDPPPVLPPPALGVSTGPAPAMSGGGTPTPDALPVIESDSIADLFRRTLDVPVEGATRGALRESFDEARSGTRKHEAIDILAPRNTPIVAVEDGTIAKLFTSVPGGLTVYQFDPTTHYAYYYAHLERYADGLVAGAHVTRHQVIGYVGTSGNAAKDTPHLHFAIFKLTEKKQWWRLPPLAKVFRNVQTLLAHRRMLVRVNVER